MRLEDLFEANPALKVSGSIAGGKSPVVLGTEFFDMAKKQGVNPKQASNVIDLFQKNNPQFRGPKMTQFMQQFFTNNPDVFKTANDNVKLATGSGGAGKGKAPKIKPSGWSKLLGFLGKAAGVAGVIAPFVTPSPNVGDGTISDEDRQAMEISDQIMRSLAASDPQAYIDMIDAEYANADKDDVQFVDPRTHPYYTDAQKRVADTQKMLDLEPIGGGIPQPSAQTDAPTLAQPEIEPEELPKSEPTTTPKFPGIPVLPDLPGPESPLEIPEPAPRVSPTAPKQPEPTQDPQDKPDAPTRDKPIEIPTTTPTKPEVDPGKETEPTVDPDAPLPKGPVVNPDAPGQPQAPVPDPEKLPDAPKVIEPVTRTAPSTLTAPGPAPRVNTDIGTTQPPRGGGKEKERKRRRGKFGLPDLTKKQRDYTLSPFTPLPMPDPMKLARYKSFGESVEEREMTKAEKAKETRLKKKYDDSGMKAAMKKQYGKDWETVYYATIRKQAMEEGYQILPPIDRDRYDEIQGMEGPMVTRSGKVVYYDPQEGAYYDRDTDMYLTYDEWKELDKAPHTAEAVKPKNDPYSEPSRPGGKNQDKGKKSPSLTTAIRGYLKGGERSLGMPDPMNIHGRLNASVKQRANALFDRALAEFEFNPRAGHMDQPSHPQNKGLTDPRKSSPRPRLRPEPEIDLSPDAEAPDQVHIKKSGAPASSPRPRLRPKDVEMKAAIDAALRQAMGEESVNEWGGDDQYEASERAIENALSIFDEMLDNGVDELRARAEAHDYLKGELGDLGVTHGDMESKQYHSELEKEIIQIMNRRDKGVKESARGLGSIDWPDVDEDGDSAMAQHAENAIRHGMHAYDAYDHVYSMSRERDWLSDNKDMIIDMFAQYGLQTEGHSPHKKGTAKYKAHMAAMHAGMRSESNINELEIPGTDYGIPDAAFAAASALANEPPAKAPKPKASTARRAAKRGMSLVSNRPTAATSAPTANLSAVQGAGKPSWGSRALGALGRLASRASLPAMILAPTQMGDGTLSPEMAAELERQAQRRRSMGEMRESLQFNKDDNHSISDNETVAIYVKTMLDESHNSWNKVQEQVQFVLDALDENHTADAESVLALLRNRNLQESIEKQIMLKENIDTLRKIVADKSVMPVKFDDGTMKVDMTTASIFLQAFDKMREDNQAKVAEMMRTKAGFLRVMDIIYGAMK